MHDKIEEMEKASGSKRFTDQEWREVLKAGFDRPASWPNPAPGCRAIGCGVVHGCFRDDCPGKGQR